MKPPDEHTVVSRRSFLRLSAAAASASMAGMLPLLPQAQMQDSLAGRGNRGTLRDPLAAGRPRDPTDAKENDAAIQAIEQRLACNCGCTLDVFTCRTTDFSCTYSPKLHREVLALREQGKTAQEILDAFVAKYGEKALMAPKPRGGFNLAGYLLPGTLVVAGGAGLLLYIGRRKAAVAGATPAGAAPALEASPDELERLRHELAEMED
jgi:cytochrome c-type biogenesis protein CcmH